MFYALPEKDKVLLTDVYNRHYRLSEAVRLYVLENGYTEEQEKGLWILISKVGAMIAKRRGLI